MHLIQLLLKQRLLRIQFLSIPFKLFEGFTGYLNTYIEDHLTHEHHVIEM